LKKAKEDMKRMQKERESCRDCLQKVKLI